MTDQDSYHNISEIRRVRNLPTKELAEYFLANEKIVAAIFEYIKLNDANKVRQLADMCFEKQQFNSAFKGYEFLNDREKMFQAAIGEQDEYLRGELLGDYLGKNTKKALNDQVENWLKTKNCNNMKTVGNIIPTVNMAYNLIHQYDVGIAIAKGGLWPAFIFELQGLPIYVAQPHKKTRSLTWKTPIDDQTLKDKKVLVIDKDVETGKTAWKVYDELSKYKPSQIGIALASNPITEISGTYGTLSQNIPSEYKKIHFQNEFTYEHFDKATQNLENRLLNSNQ
jgi:hypoxanthine phosphoribosyltransferase